MTTDELHKMGFFSWLDLLAFLRKRKKDREQFVKLVLQSPPIFGDEASSMNAETVMVNNQQVRAMAFDELYETLPMPTTVNVLIELAEDLVIHNREAEHLVTFLKKLQTRDA